MERKVMLAVMRRRMRRPLVSENKVFVRGLNMDEVQQAKTRDAIVVRRMVTP